MRRLLFVALLSSCTCSAPGGESTAPPVSTAEVPATSPVPAASEPQAPSSAEARAWRQRLREARDLAHDGNAIDAYVIFDSLVRERPGARALRCEAGYVAFRAERLDEAERLTTSAIDGWPSPPPAHDRVLLAMCLYNRGLVAEAGGDHTTAAEAWRRSLALRPNGTVQSHLDALDVPEPAEGDAAPEGAAHADGVFTFDEWLAGVRADMPETVQVEILEHIAGPTPGLEIVTVRFTTPASGDEFEEVVEEAVLSTPTDTIDLTLVSFERMFSWYDDHAEIHDASFVGADPELGQLVAVTTAQWGRGDSEDGTGDEMSSESTLWLCAEGRGWSCIEIALSSTSELLCDSGCDEREDGEGEDAEAPYVRGFQSTWTLEGGVLVLTPDPTFHPTDPAEPPLSGRLSLVDLFASVP